MDKHYNIPDYEQPIPIVPSPMPEPTDLTVDRAEAVQENGLWYVQGYRSSALIVKMGGWGSYEGTTNAKLYDSGGNLVIPEAVMQSPSLEEQVRILTAALMEMAGEIYG